MALALRLKENPPGLKFFSQEQLFAIAMSFTLKLDAGVELVFFGADPPYDKSLRWQPLDTYGVPVGQIKTFNSKEWV